VPDAASHDPLKAAWESLPRADRARLASNAARGMRGTTRKAAAFMLWWASQELRRGPRNGFRLAGAMVALLILVQFAGGASFTEIIAGASTSLIPVILLVPLATWLFRRPKLQRAIQLNAGKLSGKTYTAPPPPDDVERLLARAQRKGWLGETGADTAAGDT
jgi:hypothetical protein